MPFDYAEFIERHPLRYSCRESSVDIIYNQAVLFSERMIDFLSKSCKIPVSPESLEELLKSRNITIERRERTKPHHHASWHRLAWTDSDKKIIHIDENALQKIVESSSGRNNPSRPSFQEIRGIILAHEWFHILSENLEESTDWQSLKKGERIIMEEIAARLFSVRLTGKYTNPFLIDDMVHISLT